MLKLPDSQAHRLIKR